MNKTGIEWVRNPDGSQGYTWNPITGCLNHVNGLCKGGGFPCYAFKLAHGRLRNRYLDNRITAGDGEDDIWEGYTNPFYPRFWEERLDQPLKLKKPTGIFTCDMSDLFGLGIPAQWTHSVMNFIEACPQHRFYLLTKQPQRLSEFSPFPDNCWVGVTATNYDMFIDACGYLCSLKAKGGIKVAFISLEPLLSWEDTDQFCQFWCQHGGINWLIPGACTGTKAEMAELVQRYPALTLMPYGKIWTAQPPIAWLREIVEAADKAGIKVFLKDNLRGLLPKEPPFYTKCCAEVNGKDPCYEEPCLSEHLVDECSKAPNFWMLRQEMPIDGV